MLILCQILNQIKLTPNKWIASIKDYSKPFNTVYWISTSRLSCESTLKKTCNLIRTPAMWLNWRKDWIEGVSNCRYSRCTRNSENWVTVLRSRLCSISSRILEVSANSHFWQQKISLPSVGICKLECLSLASESTWTVINATRLMWSSRVEWVYSIQTPQG